MLNMTEQEFIEQYVERAKSIGFDISAIDDGCIYHPSEHYPECGRMFAMICDCDHSSDSHWAMLSEEEVIEETQNKISELFGNHIEEKQRWLTEARIGLRLERPVDLLKTGEGSKELLTILLQAQHGVYI